MVLFGIEETETSYESLEENIIKCVEQYFSIKLTYRDVEEVIRLGKKDIRPRPIVVTFSTLGIKIKIFKRKGALKDSQYYLKEDYPKYVLEKRKELQVQLQLEREKGNTAVIKYDKLIILKNITKRKLPTSPENNKHQMQRETHK
ncbi:Endonuclease-reverse transcriptase [Operophtera brumata]|uniref:Endonuclease-reverse transcriptase n=1 Tax=Operophtera brumata TaxID=104452 RepID=A0A0L7L9B4_OPEBR|nr:Endonuclease-reverse transcriptase [Operophtera brumata]